MSFVMLIYDGHCMVWMSMPMARDCHKLYQTVVDSTDRANTILQFLNCNNLNTKVLGKHKSSHYKLVHSRGEIIVDYHYSYWATTLVT